MTFYNFCQSGHAAYPAQQQPFAQQVRAPTPTQRAHTRTHAHTSAYEHTHAFVYACMCIRIDARPHTRTCIRVYTCIYMYIRIDMRRTRAHPHVWMRETGGGGVVVSLLSLLHAYIHTYTSIYTCTCARGQRRRSLCLSPPLQPPQPNKFLVLSAEAKALCTR